MAGITAHCCIVLQTCGHEVTLSLYFFLISPPAAPLFPSPTPPPPSHASPSLPHPRLLLATPPHPRRCQISQFTAAYPTLCVAQAEVGGAAPMTRRHTR